MRLVYPKWIYTVSLLFSCFVARCLPVAAKHSSDGLRLADLTYGPNNPLGYIASNVLTGFAFGLVLVVALAQTFSVFKWGAKWMGCMVIGAYSMSSIHHPSRNREALTPLYKLFALGIGFRFGLHVRPDSQGLYIAEYFFVILSPCAFIAADYILLGRLARCIGSGKHLLVAPNHITITFVISDITTFLIQATGGAVSVRATTSPGEKLGSHIFLGALIIQLISFIIFTYIFLRFVHRVRRFERDVWTLHHGCQWYNDWRSLAVALGISCVGIIIRSFYRVVELSQGFLGPIAKNEALFYALDTLPLFIAISVYVPFWPGRFIPLEPVVVSTELEKDAEHTITGPE